MSKKKLNEHLQCDHKNAQEVPELNVSASPVRGNPIDCDIPISDMTVDIDRQESMIIETNDDNGEKGSEFESLYFDRSSDNDNKITLNFDQF